MCGCVFVHAPVCVCMYMCVVCNVCVCVCSEFVSHLDIHAYYPMDMTHTGDPIHNTRCRINALSHCDSQSSERALCDKRHTDNVAGQWAHVSPPPPLQAQPFRDIQGSKVPGWVFRRVCHTLTHLLHSLARQGQTVGRVISDQYCIALG